MSKRKKVLILILFIVLICALVFVAFQVMKVRIITVKGCETLNEESIIALSGIETGQSILTIDTTKVMDAISAEPYVKPVSVDIVWPDCIEITIKERKEAAYIQKDDTLLVIDDECHLLKVLMQTETLSYPSVTGLQLDEYRVGERLVSGDTYQLDVLSEMMKAADANGVGLQNIDMSVAADVVLTTTDGYTVEMGDDTQIQKKFSLFKEAISELQAMGKTGGIIDVASAKKAYYREN